MIAIKSIRHQHYKDVKDQACEQISNSEIGTGLTQLRNVRYQKKNNRSHHTRDSPITNTNMREKKNNSPSIHINNLMFALIYIFVLIQTAYQYTDFQYNILHVIN